MITQQKLRETFSYNPDTGEFIWLVDPFRHKRKGKVAGCVKRHDSGKYYVRIKFDGVDYAAHRLAFLWMNGSMPDFDVDHIDGNGANNKWDNLRAVTKRENSKNQRLCSNNKSGCMGVFWNSNANRWQAQIIVDGKLIYLGTFKEKHLAVGARREAERLYGFHANHGQARPR